MKIGNISELLKISKTSVNVMPDELFLSYKKFRSRNLDFFFSDVCGGNESVDSACRWSALELTKIFSRFFLRTVINRETVGLFSLFSRYLSLKQNVLVLPVALTIRSKHIVRLRCRCSSKMWCVSAVPLLVISETSVKLS